MYEQIIKEAEPKMDKVIEFVIKKLGSFRTGRASPALVENIQVDCYGQMMPISQLASISVPSARQLSIQPWDSSYLTMIEKSILSENSGLSPVIVGESIMINMPMMSEELRKEIVKSVAQVNDDAKRTIRKHRDEAWSEIQEKSREGLIGEDAKFKGKDKLQDVVDKYNKKIDELISRKKAEIEG
ncbi:MAG: ribosome recycling factor [Candidatus Pacebacteria bacterium]|nr:ribosome recycling factor [Candidatus Paceibacterota bacterium]MDD4074248.1 ribosome recycling factor [Candidatus Paceibacterota bacterium]